MEQGRPQHLGRKNRGRAGAMWRRLWSSGRATGGHGLGPTDDYKALVGPDTQADIEQGDPIHNDTECGNDNGDGDERPAGVAPCLPPELWSVILDTAGATPEDRYIQARVCRLWRSLVLARSQSRTDIPLRIGAEVCRARIARAAIGCDDQTLFAWAIHESLAAPLPLTLVHKLWRRIAVHGALGCAVVMRMAGPWPLPCDRTGCRCEADPPPTTSVAPKHRVRVHRSCRRVRLVLVALKHKSLAVASLLLSWHVAHPMRWVQAAAATALAGGHIGVLNLMWDNGIEPYLCASTTCLDAPRPSTWAQMAAEANQAASLAWIVDHLRPDDNLLDQCLIDAARRGASDTVLWLCQRQHFGGFAQALVAATASGHPDTLASMAPYVAAARAYLEARGLSLDRSITTTKEYKALANGKRTPLANLLRGRSADHPLVQPPPPL
ncbi:hypothetical protein pqer_cds_810 [Pandoravirus quercus]|uniref:F-box incomplete domain containing protein n=1 Tax=Pandoravirus quercus TaxID=2107709 RepID=A0A2U7UA10_9VIRU|nr:hypothetical protein pqer_cds_810 [Pandoravirus quercus]AVK75232.1 hypothetical protein pqer_cds_810 [Pandoravirus quercus]